MAYKIIVNPWADKGRGKASVDAIVEEFTAHGAEFHVEYTQRPGHAADVARLAVYEGWPYVVAVGGDGTMGEVLQGVAGTDTALGIIPAGTGNDLAMALGMPKDLRAAARALLTAPTIQMDVGRDVEGYFGIILGLAYATDAMRYVNTHSSIFRGPLHILAGILSVLQCLRAYEMEIVMDNEIIRDKFSAVFIMNIYRTGGGLLLAPEASVTDGLFDVVLVRELSKIDFLFTLPKAYKGRHLSHPRVSIHRTRSIRITTHERMEKLFDGNVHGCTPVDACVVPGGLRVLSPAKGVARC